MDTLLPPIVFTVTRPSVCIYPPEGGEEIARAGDESVVLTTIGFGSESRS
jgi:hypothetical protein